MAKNLIRTDGEVIDAAVTAGDELVGRLAGRHENLSGTEYDELFALIEALPFIMDLEEHVWMNARIVNARDSSNAGESVYEIYQFTRRLRRKHGVMKRTGR